MVTSAGSAEVDAYVDGDRRTPSSAAGQKSAKKAPDDPPLDGGAHIGRYVVLYRHGRGGMGHIYAAYDPELDRRVAIKLLKRSKRRGRDAHGRMIREAQALARLSHPNVVAVHDVGLYEGRVWVAMDFVEGLTLRRWGGAETRTLEETLEVFVQAGRGLASAHKAGLVHRDFKPDNVIVDGEGRAQVLDFGLARAAHSGAYSGQHSGIRLASHDSMDQGEPIPLSTSSGSLSLKLTRDGALVGTPAYMAPEQHLRQPTDARTDQFAFCLALYEALYRESPFAGDDEKELRDNVIHGRHRAPPRRAKVPRWLHRALLRGLEVEPADRWPTMDALLAAIARDHRGTKKRVGLAAVGVAVIATSVAGSMLAVGPTDDRCEAVDTPVYERWNDARRAAIESAFMDTGKPYAAAVWRSTDAVLSEYAESWAQARHEACEATWVRETQTQEALVLRLSCLQRRLDELDGLATAFEHADGDVVERAVQAAHDLTSLEACADVSALASTMPLPDDPRDRVLAEDLRARLSDARTRGRAGHYAEGVEVAQTAVEDARAMAFRPLEAESLVTLGSLQVRDGATKAARITLQDAVYAAEAGDHETAVAEAWVLLLDVARLHPELHDEADDWRRHAAAHVERIGRGTPLDARLQEAVGNLYASQAKYGDAVKHLRRAMEIHEARQGETPDLGQVLTGLGNAYTGLGRFDEALAHHERALALLREQVGESHPAVATAMTGLAVTYDQLGRGAQAEPLYAKAVQIFGTALGDWHPKVATALNNYAGVLYARGDLDGALERFERALTIWEAAYGPEHPDVALTLGNIGLTLEGLEQYDRAIEHHERALALRRAAWGEAHPDVAVSLRNLGDLHYFLRHFEEAREHHERALSVLEKTLGSHHPQLADILEGLGGDLQAQDDHDGALTHYRRSLAIRESALGPEHAFVAGTLAEIGKAHLARGDAPSALPPLTRAVRIFDGRPETNSTSASARFALAQALWTVGQEKDRARTLAERAAREYSATAATDDATRVRAWLEQMQTDDVD